MKVSVIPCGEVVNESEAKAIDCLKRNLQSAAAPPSGNSGAEWILLTNLAFSVTNQFQSDDIDLIAIGPPGVRVIEIKHWSDGWRGANDDLFKREADKVTYKARKIGTTLRRIVADLARVEGTILLTCQQPKIKKMLEGSPVRGVPLYSLSQWKSAVGFDCLRTLTPVQVRLLAKAIEPKCAVRVDGSLRRFAGYVNLERQTPEEERFHRIYRGSHPTRRDKVILHLYDLSASDDNKAEVRARREAAALQRLQLYPWAPRILDSFQDAAGYAGEMYFFTISDPAAPTLEVRAGDKNWDARSRLLFAREAILALDELHNAGDKDDTFVHRNLTPQTILVRSDNKPIFTGFDWMRIPSDISVASSSLSEVNKQAWVAPEVLSQGLSVAGQRSDIFSLCVCLGSLFVGQVDDLSPKALEILCSGQDSMPDQRSNLVDLERSISELLGDSVAPPPPPPSRFWTEEQVIRFRERQYRIVSRLGSGGVGTTFKVVELDRSSQEEVGTYVAKIVHDGETGDRVLKSYRLARSHLGRHDGLSPIYEVASEWQENQFVSLLGWVDGTPLNEFIGVFPLLAEDQDEQTAESLAIRWLKNLCEALNVLHSGALIHGDISPRNMIVSGSSLVLTDYDFVARIGDEILDPGTLNYCSPERQQKKNATATDDLFALAASFFHVLFEREPFRFGGELVKDRGLNWEGVNRDEFPNLVGVLDQATHKDQTQRFRSAEDMLNALSTLSKPPENDLETGFVSGGCAPTDVVETPVVCPSEVNVLKVSSEHRVTWLKSLLQSYPGSRWGNSETRGLDTEFASTTYVRTALEESLLESVRKERVRLVILCGNAGDGKTALLQHLAMELGLGRHKSVDRILEGRIPNGPQVRMNLDGSAAWKGKSADELLDDFLAPFQDGQLSDNIVHMLAINDGRLLEWIEGVEERLGRKTKLTENLYELLQGKPPGQDLQIRFINLNQRSLVGGITDNDRDISTEFLKQLVDHLYGGNKAPEIWSPCKTCSANEHCLVFQAARVFGPDSLFPDISDNDQKRALRSRAQKRLFESLQAVHLRGETHITVREIRAALVYILFGIHFCDDYRFGIDLDGPRLMPYWDRAFAANSPARQGEVLRDLARFDPALEAHPQVDRYLQSQQAFDEPCSTPHYPELSLESARRRAFFEWTEEDLRQVLRSNEQPSEALDLARGSHIREFRKIPLIHDVTELKKITRQLCIGISKLEDLPLLASQRSNAVPLRITPRTPTETAFWVEKPLENFRLEPDLPSAAEGIERLHRQVALIYRYRDGNEERLLIGAELFHLLLELAEGYQLGDVSTDDTFAHLSIFVQRLVREDERELFAWNPMQDEKLYRVSAVLPCIPAGEKQALRIQEILTEVTT